MCVHTKGHARVIAVAGAGKTATLTHYITKRIGHGGNPKRMLVLMYNAAVQKDFERRLRILLPEHPPAIRTFHSLGLRLYKSMIACDFLKAAKLQPLSNLVIELQLKKILQNLKTVPKIESVEDLNDWIEAASQFIQHCKSHLKGPTYSFEELDLDEKKKCLLEVFDVFEQWRRNEGFITYDDMLYDPAKVLNENDACRAHFSNKLDEILVDEYQDINPIQHFLLQALAGERASVMVIGDPDQTIYEFRGSSPKFINTQFSNDFSDSKNYSLSQTFRFGHELALAANHLISNNQQRDKTLTISAENTPTTRIRTSETKQHGSKVVDAIVSLRERGASYSAMAILCRLWSFARPVELELMARNIPYNMEGDEGIFHRSEIRPIFHLLTLLSGDFFNKNEPERADILFDILSVPAPRISHAVLRKIARNWAKEIKSNKIASTLRPENPKELNAFQLRALNKRIKALRSLETRHSCVAKISQYLRRVDYYNELEQHAFSQVKGEEQVHTAGAFMRFLQQLGARDAQSILAHLQDMRQASRNHVSDAVTLTTIHKSKGREWPVVFIPDLSEGHLPYFGSGKAEKDTLEAERRLMYVAMTRAQRHLFITTPHNDATSEEVDGAPSRFIEEMNLQGCQSAAKNIYNQVSDSDGNTPITSMYLNSVSLHP